MAARQPRGGSSRGGGGSPPPPPPALDLAPERLDVNGVFDAKGPDASAPQRDEAAADAQRGTEVVGEGADIEPLAALDLNAKHRGVVRDDVESVCPDAARRRLHLFAAPGPLVE